MAFGVRIAGGRKGRRVDNKSLWCPVLVDLPALSHEEGLSCHAQPGHDLRLVASVAGETKLILSPFFPRDGL